ncbi:MAG: hypothetical protein HZB10_03605 [Candidatus Yonathbacteria bacterium]|nr:hypothetical protein [Candidatus Yonathbacteria bacterium]
MNRNKGNVLVWTIVAIVVFSIFINHGSDKSSAVQSSVEPASNFYRSPEVSESHTISRDDAISEHWDEIKDLVDGSETVEACSSSSGSCYDLDADISSGAIEQIYFPSGGYLYFSADIDKNGEASDSDQNGDDWDFTLDMDSSIVDDAVNNWANANGYTIE